MMPSESGCALQAHAVWLLTQAHQSPLISVQLWALTGLALPAKLPWLPTSQQLPAATQVSMQVHLQQKTASCTHEYTSCLSSAVIYIASLEHLPDMWMLQTAKSWVLSLYSVDNLHFQLC